MNYHNWPNVVLFYGLVLCVCVSFSLKGKEYSTNFPTSLSCASYIITNGTQGNVTGTCTFPDLYSTTNRTCLPFTDVDCGNRPEWTSPCEYPNSNCIMDYDNNTGICACPPEHDLNYNGCSENGFYAWPARRWTRFYIECRDNRTLTFNCSGASEIFDFIGDKGCNNIKRVVSEAYNQSGLKQIPTSLRYMLGGSFTATPTKSLSMSSSAGLTKVTPTPVQSLHKSQMTEIDSTGSGTYDFSFALTGLLSLHSFQTSIDSLSTTAEHYSITATSTLVSLQKSQMPATDALGPSNVMLNTSSVELRSFQQSQMPVVDSLSPSTDFYSIYSTAFLSIDRSHLSDTISLSRSTGVSSVQTTVLQSQMPAVDSLNHSTEFSSIKPTVFRSEHASHTPGLDSLSPSTEISSVKPNAFQSLQRSDTLTTGEFTGSYSASLYGNLRKSTSSSLDTFHSEKTKKVSKERNTALYTASEYFSVQIDNSYDSSVGLNTFPIPESSVFGLNKSSHSHSDSIMLSMPSPASLFASQTGAQQTVSEKSSVQYSLSEQRARQSAETTRLYPAVTLISTQLTAAYNQDHSFSSPLSQIESSDIYLDQSLSTFQMSHSSEFELTQSTDINRYLTAFPMSSYAAHTASQIHDTHAFGQFLSETSVHKPRESMSLYPTKMFLSHVSTTQSTVVTKSSEFTNVTTILGHQYLHTSVMSENVTETQLVEHRNAGTSTNVFQTTQTSTFSESVLFKQSMSNRSSMHMSTRLTPSAIHMSTSSQPRTTYTTQAGFLSSIDTLYNNVAETLETKTSTTEISSLGISTPQVLLSEPVYFSTTTLAVTPTSIGDKTSMIFQTISHPDQMSVQSNRGKDESEIKMSISSPVISNFTETSTAFRLPGNYQQSTTEMSSSLLSVVTSSQVPTVRIVSKVSSVVQITHISTVSPSDSSEELTTQSPAVLSTITTTLSQQSTSSISKMNITPAKTIMLTDKTDALSESILNYSYTESSAHSQVMQTAIPSETISSELVALSKTYIASLTTKVSRVSSDLIHTSATNSITPLSIQTLDSLLKQEYTLSTKPHTLESTTASKETIFSTPVSTSSDSVLSTSFTLFNVLSVSTKQSHTVPQEHVPSLVVLQSSDLLMSSLLSSTPSFHTSTKSLLVNSYSSISPSSSVSIPTSNQISGTSTTQLSNTNNASARKSASSKSSDRLVVPLAVGITSGVLVIVALTVVAIVSIRRHSPPSKFPKEGLTARL